MVIAGVAFYNGLNTSGNNTTKGIGNVSDIEVRALYEGTVQVPEIALETSLPIVPEKMAVYTVDRSISEKELLQIADNLDVSDVVSKNPSGLIFVGEVRSQGYGK